jgi:DNA-binding response OmpR family regulator
VIAAPPTSDAVRVLVVEDDPDQGFLLSTILQAEGREVLLADSGEAAQEVLDTTTVSLILLDLLLPDTDGRTLLSSIRSRPESARVPVIILSGKTSTETKAECYNLGADSFIEKPFDVSSLATDVTARLERAVARPASGPGPGDRPRLADFLEALDAARGGPHGVLVAQIDGVPTVAERCGWATTDMILDGLAGSIDEVLGPDGPVARLTGDEMGAVLDGVDPAEGGVRGEQVVEAVRTYPVRASDGESFSLTASVGLAFPVEGKKAKANLDEARALVLRAQRAGGNRLATADAGESMEVAPIIVADDDDITAKILTHRLEREGFRVTRFDNGSDAYKGALKETPALVLLDVKMPGMDGFEVLERLRKTPSYAQIPIVMLTSMGSDADVVRGFELGADDYMLKPFSPAELMARLRRLLRTDRRPLA